MHTKQPHCNTHFTFRISDKCWQYCFRNIVETTLTSCKRIFHDPLYCKMKSFQHIRSPRILRLLDDGKFHHSNFCILLPNMESDDHFLLLSLVPRSLSICILSASLIAESMSNLSYKGFLCIVGLICVMIMCKLTYSCSFFCFSSRICK